MISQRIAFVIMQIGNPLLDEIYTEVYIPAIKAAKLAPKRIDQDNEGQLLKKEIIDYIEKADIIIADLTNARPNCYLEVGYAMGLDKFRNLIFTAKEDHYPESENFKKGGPKIHFDIAGYDILFWHSNNKNEFKSKLTERINRRLSIICPTNKKIDESSWDESELKSQRKYVAEKFNTYGHRLQMEVLASPLSYNLNIPQNELLEIANNSQIFTMGWPIGVVFIDVPEFKPIPKADGIISEVQGNVKNTYDFSYFKKNGQIYITKNLIEETNHIDSLLVEARVKRVTELLVYLQRYYSRCNLPTNERIKIALKYIGLKNNRLRFANSNYMFRGEKVSNENEYFIELITSCSEIEANLTEKVHEIVKGLFVLFDFSEIEFGKIKNIVSEFVKNARR